LGRKRWIKLVERQNRYYTRDRYLFWGVVLFGTVLAFYNLSLHVLKWLPSSDFGSLLSVKQMRVLFPFTAFFYGLESEKKYYLIRTRIPDTVEDEKYIQTHLSAMHILRMHAFDFGHFHKTLLIRRIPAILLFMGTGALFAYSSSDVVYYSAVIGYAAFIFLMIMAGADLWYRLNLCMLKRGGFLNKEKDPAKQVIESVTYVLEGAVWCMFFMQIGLLMTNTLVIHFNMAGFLRERVRILEGISISRERVRIREGVALFWLIAATILHIQAHLKGKRQKTILSLLVIGILIVDLLFYFQM